MWQWVARGNIQQISNILQTEQHSPFGLMLLRLGNVTTIQLMAYNVHANTFVFSQTISNVYCPGLLLQSPENRPTLENKPTPFFFE